MIFECHSHKQQEALLSDAKITLLLTGIQFGKTTIGSIWMHKYICQHTYKDNNFIITAPNYKIMQQSTLPAFLKQMEGRGTYHKADAMFKTAWGTHCYLRTSTEPDSIVGITNVRAIWGDEAGKYSLYFWENMQARASFRNCPIMLTTTPYTTNWLFKDLVKPVKDKKRDDIKLIQASSNENPYFPQEEFTRRKLTMDPRRFAALYLGEFEKMHGLVYDCFDDVAHVMEPLELPIGTRYFGGIDWGFTDPFVLNIRAITPSGHHFLVSEFYKTGLTITDMVIVAKQKMSLFGVKLFYADPSQPGLIEELNRSGVPCVGADNDIRRGVDLHYGLIREGKYHVFSACKHTLDEYSTYHYPEPEELRPDQDSKEQKPVGQDDHCFPGDTLVETEHGPKPIKTIKPGDLVLTTLGLKKVLLTHQNGIKPLIKIGNLRCTAEHQIYTYNRGFVMAKDLVEGDRLCHLKKLSLTEKAICATRSLSTRTFQGIFLGLVGRKRQRFIYTGKFGNFITEKFQRAITFTTEMAITLITQLKTLSVYQSMCTYPSIALITTKSLKRRQSNTWTILDIWRLLGTKVKKAAHGTGGMQKTIVQNRKLESVMFAGNNTLISSLHPDSVAGPVRLETEEMVYDLTVEDAHEYFANNYLVHNCMDVERYLTMSLYRTGQVHVPKVPEEAKPTLDHEKRIAQRKKGKNRYPGSERWS